MLPRFRAPFFAVVRAAVDRAGAKGIKKITGTDPGVGEKDRGCLLVAPQGDVRVGCRVRR